MKRPDPGNLFLAATGKVFRFVEYNHGLVIACVLALGMAGCEAFFPVKAPSPVTGALVTQEELQRELDATIRQRDAAVGDMMADAAALVEKAKWYDAETDVLVGDYETANTQINDGKERRNKLLTSVTTIAGTVNPGVGTLLSGLLAGGLGYDNVRKSLSIRRAKKGGGS